MTLEPPDNNLTNADAETESSIVAFHRTSAQHQLQTSALCTIRTNPVTSRALAHVRSGTIGSCRFSQVLRIHEVLGREHPGY